MQTVKVTKIYGRGTAITEATREVGNAVYLTGGDIYPPLEGSSTLTIVGGSAKIAVEQTLIEGKDYKYRTLGKNWEIEFLTAEPQVVAYND